MEEEEEAEGEAISRAIENRTRAGRARKPTQKALESLEQAKPPKRGPKKWWTWQAWWAWWEGVDCAPNYLCIREFIRKD